MSYKYSSGSIRKGDIYFEDDREGEPTFIDFGQDTISLRPSGSAMLNVSASRVGIGTVSPDYTLDVAGDIGVDQNIYHNGDADTLIQFTDDKIVLKAGNRALVTAEVKDSQPHEVTINDGSNNVDFVVKGNGSGEGNPGMKFDASTNRLGINGVGTPDEVLHVDGNIKAVGNDVRIKIDGDTDSHPGLELYENGTRKWIVFNDYTNDNLTFKTNSNVRMSIKQDGAVGIGTETPDHTLSVVGDISASVHISASSFYGDGSNLTGISGGGGSGPAGSNTEIQFNDGGANFGASSNLTYDGTNLKVATTSGNPVFSLEATEDGATANPVFTLKRNSASPADADYLGQLKFLGENDADQEVTYAKITGKISDASDGTEDGILEFANIKAGSQTVTARLRSDSLQLLNSTGLTVDGDVGIGTTSPLTTLHVHADSINDGAVTISQADNSGDASQLDLSKARGSGASPTAVQNSDFIGQVRMLGYDGDSYDNFADIYVQAAGTISTTSHPSKLIIRTTQASATSPTTAVTIDENQDMTVAGAVLGKMRHMTHHRYNDGSGTGKEYIPWAGTSEQNSPSWITQGVAPYAGKLLKVLLRSSKTGGMGSTVVGIHTNVDGNTVINSTPEETETVNMTTANTTYTFDFSSSTHFGPGDVIGVSIDPTNAHGNVNVTCVWEYDIT